MTAPAAVLDPADRALFAGLLERQRAKVRPKRSRQWATPGALAKHLDPLTVQTPALDAIDQALVQLADGDYDRLIICIPPQEGKSVRTSQRFVEWLLEHQPDLRIAIVSYSDEVARRWGRDIKQDLGEHPELGLRLRADSKAAGRWQIAGHRGGVYCCGVGGSLTGFPVDVLIVDDPVQDLDHAQSPVYRDKARRFWQGTAVPRLGPGTKAVVIQTRFHADDLAGWLQANDSAGRWRVLSIPAVAEDDDPIGRAPGEELQSARGDRNWAQIKAEVGPYVWASLYQQRPAPAEGGIFKKTSLRRWAPLTDVGYGPGLDLGGRPVWLRDTWRFLTVDLAASTKTSADFTVVAVWGIGLDGDLVLLDGARVRVDPAGHWPLVRRLREQHQADAVYVESRMFGTTLVYEAARANVPVVELHADTDKFTRALPASARAEASRLWLPPDSHAEWVPGWVDELIAFPNAAHDDVVDVVAYAARVAAAHWLPMESAAQEQARTAGLSDELDLLTVAY